MELTKFFLAIFITAAVITISGYSACNGAGLNINAPIPPLQLPTADGANFDLDSFHARPAVITFFTAWSKTCLENLKFLKTLQSRHKNKLEIIAVSLDQKTSALNSFLKNNNFPFTFLSDKKLKTLNDFHVLIIPMTFLLDEDKILKNIYIDFDEAIEKSISNDVADLITPKKTGQ